MSKTIRTLQTKLGLQVDGIAGKNTLRAIAQKFDLTLIGAAHLLGQCYHETEMFTKFRENLNYSAQGLANTWPHRYAVDAKAKIKVPNDLAYRLERKPIDIANNVYANRMGNGDEQSGDGWKYRGVGAIHLTGKDNVTAFSRHIGRPDLILHPDNIENDLAFEAAHFFFFSNNLFKECKDLERETIKRVSNGVNRGNVNSSLDPIGFEHRIQSTLKIYNLLK